MATYHLNVKICGRGRGIGGSDQSPIASSAYQCGEKLYNDKDGEVKDYGNKERIVATGLELAKNFPSDWMREKLWNEVEQSEKNPKAQLYRKWEMALPKELPIEKNIELTKKFIQENFVKNGMCADWAIHCDADGKNPHIHIMTTVRAMDANHNWLPKQRKNYILDRNGKKIYDKKTKKYKCGKSIATTNWDTKEFLQDVRSRWAEAINRNLANAGLDDFVSEKSFKDLASENEIYKKLQPTKHRGYSPKYEYGNKNIIEANENTIKKYILDNLQSGKDIENLKNETLKIKVANISQEKIVKIFDDVLEKLKITQQSAIFTPKSDEYEKTDKIPLQQNNKLASVDINMTVIERQKEKEENQEPIISTHKIKDVEKEHKKDIAEEVKPTIITSKQDYTRNERTESNENQKYNKELVEMLCNYAPNEAIYTEDYLKNNIETIKMIANRDFEGAAEKFFIGINTDTNVNTDEERLEFMKYVIACHGTDTEIILKAVDIVAMQEKIDPIETAKLLQDTLNLPKYRDAFESEQGIWSNMLTKITEKDYRLANSKADEQAGEIKSKGEIEKEEKNNEDILEILSHSGKYCIQNSTFELAYDDQGHPSLDNNGRCLTIQDIMYKSDNIPDLVPMLKQIANKDIAGACKTLNPTKYASLNNEQKADIIMRYVVNLYGTKNNKMLGIASRIVSKELGVNYPSTRITGSAEYQQTQKRGGEGILSKFLSKLSGRDDKWARLDVPPTKKEIDDWQYLSETEKKDIQADMASLERY